MTVTERNSSRRGIPDEPTGWSKGLEVTTGGTAVVSHAGPVLLRRLVDKTGLTAGLSKALATQRLLVHDRGRVTVDLACAIADGAEVISDFRILADQRELSGLVASVPTAWRTLSEIASGGPRAQARISGAVNAVRRQAWASIEARHGAIPGVRVAGKVVEGVICIRLDASVVTCHSDKEGAEPNFKGFGLHPLLGLLRQHRRGAAASGPKSRSLGRLSCHRRLAASPGESSGLGLPSTSGESHHPLVRAPATGHRAEITPLL